MTEHVAERDSTSKPAIPPRLVEVNCTTAEVLVHRRLLAHLITTILPTLFGQDGVDKAKRDLHAIVATDLERARFLGSSPASAEAKRSHANAILDTILIGPPRKRDATAS